jgi:phage virion morphogenesis protein
MRLSISGSEEIRLQALRFRGMAARATNLLPVNERIADYLMNMIDQTFKSQGRRGGGSWKELTPDWKDRKAKQGKDLRILYYNGKLRLSLTQRENDNQILVVTNDEVSIGSTLPYARRHQKGDTKGNIPARPYIKILRTDRQNVSDMVAKYIARGQ